MARKRKWFCTDSYGGEADIEAETAEEAAELFVDWGSDDSSTFWVDVRCVPVVDGKLQRDEYEVVTITVEPNEPDCPMDQHGIHDWQQPQFLGGDPYNPGVQGHGGGACGVDVCVQCGCGRHWDSWAQRPDTGQQGLSSVQYVEHEFEDEIERRRDEDD